MCPRRQRRRAAQRAVTRQSHAARSAFEVLEPTTPNEYARRLAETAERKVSLTADSAYKPD
jgi:hypothetical protein